MPAPAAAPDPFAPTTCLPLSPCPADLAVETLRAVLAHLKAGPVVGGPAGVARGIAVEAVVELLIVEGYPDIAILFDQAMAMEGWAMEAGMTFPEDDFDFEDLTVTAVEPWDGGGWSIGLSSGWSFSVPADSPITPTPGMPIRLYGEEIGYVVRGLFLDGRRVYYRTEAEQRAEDRRLAEEHDRERRYDFERQRADMDRQYAVLPDVFRRRLDRFRRNNPDFRWKFERYELFCCEQSVILADALDTGDSGTLRAAFDEFYALPWEEQVARVPDLSGDHSGNTFGMAMKLAYLSLGSPEDVVRLHGALAVVVGSEEYGCVPRG